MDVERRIAASNSVNGDIAALMRRQNISTAASLAVHNVELVPTLLYVGITEEKIKKEE